MLMNLLIYDFDGISIGLYEAYDLILVYTYFMIDIIEMVSYV